MTVVNSLKDSLAFQTDRFEKGIKKLVTKWKKNPLNEKQLLGVFTSQHVSLLMVLNVIRLFLHPHHLPIPFNDPFWGWTRMKTILNKTFLKKMTVLIQRTIRLHPMILHLALPLLLDPRIQLHRLEEISNIGGTLGCWMWFVTATALGLDTVDTTSLVAGVDRWETPSDLSARPELSTTRTVSSERTLRLILKLNGAWKLIRTVVQVGSLSVSIWDPTCAHHSKRVWFSCDRQFPHRLYSFSQRATRNIVAQMVANSIVSLTLLKRKRMRFIIRVVVMDRYILHSAGIALFTCTTTLHTIRQLLLSKGGLRTPTSNIVFLVNGTKVGKTAEKRKSVASCLPLLVIFCRQSTVEDDLEFEKRAADVVNRVQLPLNVPKTLVTEVPSLQMTRQVSRLHPIHDENVHRICENIGTFFQDWESTLSFGDINHFKRVRTAYGNNSNDLQCDSPPQVLPEIQVPTIKNFSVETIMMKMESSLLNRAAAARRKQIIPELHPPTLPLYCVGTLTHSTLFFESHETKSLENVAIGEKLLLQDGVKITVDQINSLSDGCVEMKLRDPYIGSLTRSSVWKCVDKNNDHRPLWLRDIQFYIHHPFFDFQSSVQEFISCKYPVKYQVVEELLEQEQWSKEKSWDKYLVQLPLFTLLEAKFDQLCLTHPPAEYIDGVKFAKFARNSQFLVKNIDITTIDSIYSGIFSYALGGMNHDGFLQSLREIAKLLYPTALLKNQWTELFLKKLIVAPTTHVLWVQLIDTWRMISKTKLMESRAQGISAAARIQTQYRRCFHERQYRDYRIYYHKRWVAARSIQTMPRMLRCFKKYNFFRDQIIHLQSFAKMKPVRRKYLQFLRDREFRCSTQLQKWAHHCLGRIRFWYILHRKYLERRGRIRKKRSRLAYRTTSIINGNYFLISIYRSQFYSLKDRQYSCEVYNPNGSRRYCTAFSETFVSQLVPSGNTKPALEYLSRNLLLQNDRMEVSSRPLFHGAMLHREAFQIQQKYYIVDFFRRMLKFRLSIYSVDTHMTHISEVSPSFLSHCHFKLPVHLPPTIEMITELFILIKNLSQTSLLKRVMLLLLYKAPTIEIVTEFEEEVSLIYKKRDSLRSLQSFVSEKEENEDAEVLDQLYIAKMANRIQSLYRRAVKAEEIQEINADMDIHEIIDEWQEYYDDSGVKFYFNPATGISSWINDIQAAKRIQSWFRESRLGDLGKPSISLLLQAAAFHQNIPTSYNKTDSIESIEKYVLNLHVMLHKYSEAYTAYETILTDFPENPIINGLFAILLIVSNRHPKDKNWERAHHLLENVHQKDAQMKKWETIESSCFVWAALCNPEDDESLTNLAVFQQCIRKNYDKTERLYRRALMLSFNPMKLSEIYNHFLHERWPNGRYAKDGPGRITYQCSIIIERYTLIGIDWYCMQDPNYRSEETEYFYYNVQHKTTHWTLPE